MFYILLAAAILAALFDGTVLVCYLTVFYNSTARKRRGPGNYYERPAYAPYAEQMKEGVRHYSALPFETVRISSSDGLTLVGSFYDAGEGSPVLLMFHGYRSAAVCDFSCAIPFFIGRGMSILTVDQRAHGRSGGHTMTFGVRESDDCLRWSEYVAARFPDRKIILDGLSMGAATVMTASDLPLPEQVCGIIADCGFSSPEEIIKTVMRARGIPLFLFFFVRLGARFFGRFDLLQRSAADALGRSKLPLLLIHGTGDKFVPCEMSRQCREARGDCVLVEVADAGHGLSYLVDGDRVERAAGEFLDRVLVH